MVTSNGIVDWTKYVTVNEKISNNLVLELHIPDFEKAKKFYTFFGFEQALCLTSEGSNRLGYMTLKREDKTGTTFINFYGNKKRVLKHSHFVNFPANTPRGYAVEITIPVSGVEQLWNTVKTKVKSSAISQPLMLKKRGQKDFRVIDPFGFYIRFTELVDLDQ